jgi:hypothetical protein
MNNKISNLKSGNGIITDSGCISKSRFQLGISLTISGYLIFLLGARPGILGLDNSFVIGFVQITVFLIGLAILAIGGNISLTSLWPDRTPSLLGDFGRRVISTGYVICFFTAFADVFGFGSHPLPNVFLGQLQARGVELGMVIIAIGFIMLVRFKKRS